MPCLRCFGRDSHCQNPGKNRVEPMKRIKSISFFISSSFCFIKVQESCQRGIDNFNQIQNSLVKIIDNCLNFRRSQKDPPTSQGIARTTQNLKIHSYFQSHRRPGECQGALASSLILILCRFPQDHQVITELESEMKTF